MSILKLASEAMPIEGPGHVLYDVGLGAAVGVLMFFKAIEFLRTLGILPENKRVVETSGNGYSGRTVGKISVFSLKEIIRQEIRTELSGKLDQMILLLTRMVTILEERR